MSKKRKLPDMTDCCRFCLARNVCSKDVFDERIRPKFQDLEKCANLQIVDRPKYPKKICYVCLYKLEMWNNFKSKFLETSKSLSTRFNVEDPPLNDVDYTQVNENNVENKKRKIDNAAESNLQSPPPMLNLRDPSELLQSTSGIHPESETNPKKIVDSIIEDFATDSTLGTEPTQSQTAASDATSTSRKTARLKNLEHREAQTKRWLERKNARLAAKGEVLSESESDNGFQLSPVQKARAKANKEHEVDDDEDEEKHQKKIIRVMKNLETNLTEKFQSNQVPDGEERSMRLRRGNTEDGKSSPTKKGVDEKVQPKGKTKNLQIASNEPDGQTTANNDVNILLEKNDVTNVQQTKGKRKPFKPQHVRSEVTVNNATYVISTSLDLPESSVSTNVPSKNGINIDITSNEGGKFDIMNAVQLQRVSAKESKQKTTENNENEFNVEKCFKIKVEGMAQEDLQRVQEDLINFINQDIGQRLLQDAASSGGKITPKESMEAYKNLNQKLKEIVEKFLRQNIEQEKMLQEVVRNRGKILPEHSKAAETSASFQPKVWIDRLDRNLFKRYKINNQQILEDVKRQRGLVGPLSRAFNKRKPVLPKKYDDFSLSTKPDPSEYARLPSKPAPKPPTLAPNLLTHFSMDTTDNLPVVPEKDVPEKTLQLAEPIEAEPKPTVTKPPVLTPTLVPKTIVPVTSLPKNIPVISKVRKSAQSTPKSSPQTTIPIIRKVQPVKMAPKPAKAITAAEDTKPKTTQETTTKSPVKPSKPEAKTEKSTQPPPITISQINEAPIMITDDDDYDAIMQASEATSSSKSVTLNDDTVVIMDPPALSESETTKAVISKEKTITVVASTNSSDEKSIVLTTPPPLTNSKPEKKLSALAEFMKIPAAKKIPMKESKASETIASSPPKASIPPPQKSKPILTKPKTVIQRQRHICGICGEELFSKEEAEAHVKNHKIETVKTPVKKVTTNSITANSAPKLTSNQKGAKVAKPKLMKCKRCQAIVEAVNVKTHVCNSIKYNCTLCECSFGADHLLVQHMETHVQPSKDVKKIKDSRLINRDDNSKMSELEDQEDDLENILSDKQAEGYSCFVCDKVFVDEEQMKDHLQMHCEEVSEEINDKHGFQCAFCAEKFQSEEALESHVGNHLMENGDEKISMMINLETRRHKKNLFQCEQCSETFTSSLLLAMHLPLHEEEEEQNPTAEYEESVEHQVCQICDEIFETPEELSEHLDVHNGNTHVCILCEKSFASIKELQEHVSSHL